MSADLPIPPAGERHGARRGRTVLAVAAALGATLAVALVNSSAHSQAPAPTASASPPVAGPSPVGEIAFDHTIHAGKYAIPCLDCHAFADKTPVAGLPSARKCMGCHKFVAKESAAIQTLAARFEAGESLRWQRVFYLPDHIYFTHRMHVRANVACSECHGDIAAMKTVTQSTPFTMGRCLACHEQRNATRDCVSCHK